MVKKGNNIVYPKEHEAKLKDANRQLRSQVKRLKNEIKELNKQVKELHNTINRNVDHIGDMMEGWTVEQAITNAQKQDNPSQEDVKKSIKSKYRKLYSGESNE